MPVFANSLSACCKPACSVLNDLAKHTDTNTFSNTQRKSQSQTYRTMCTLSTYMNNRRMEGLSESDANPANRRTINFPQKNNSMKKHRESDKDSRVRSYIT